MTASAAPAATATWAPVPEGSGFGIDHLPWGVAELPDGRNAVVTRIGDHVLEIADALDAPSAREFCTDASLDALIAAGPARRARVRTALVEHLTDRRNVRPLPSVKDVTMVLPLTVGDYVDFYASLEHATALGRLFRPDGDPLLPNWRHLPVGYHGRSASIAVSGTPVRRPTGLVAGRDGAAPRRVPSERLDLELEVGFIVGAANDGRPLRPDDAADFVFGAVLVNDWSARDIQAFEYQPLGPNLGKSFLTSMSGWIVPFEALANKLVEPPTQHPTPDPFLRAERPWGVDVDLTVEVNGTVVSRTNARHLYWTFAQMLAHLSSNGGRLRPGDLIATGTVSGPGPAAAGSLIEASDGGRSPIALADGSTRTFLLDGDTVTLRGSCGGSGGPIEFGAVTGTVAPAEVPE